MAKSGGGSRRVGALTSGPVRPGSVDVRSVMDVDEAWELVNALPARTRNEDDEEMKMEAADYVERALSEIDGADVFGEVALRNGRPVAAISYTYGDNNSMLYISMAGSVEAGQGLRLFRRVAERAAANRQSIVLTPADAAAASYWRRIGFAPAGREWGGWVMPLSAIHRYLKGAR